MKLAPLLALASLVALQPAKPVETAIERLATCQDSWRDWKDDPAQSKKVGEQVYPESVGMGVGFSARAREREDHHAHGR
jgi:hypothetical protein